MGLSGSIAELCNKWFFPGSQIITGSTRSVPVQPCAPSPQGSNPNRVPWDGRVAIFVQMPATRERVVPAGASRSNSEDREGERVDGEGVLSSDLYTR